MQKLVARNTYTPFSQSREIKTAGNSEDIIKRKEPHSSPPCYITEDGVSRGKILMTLATEFDEQGLNCMAAGDYNEAMYNYLQAIDLDPSCLTAYYHCATAYIRLQDYDNALKVITKLLKLCPPMAPLHEMRGTVNYCLKRYDTAIEDYSRAIKINPDGASSHYGRGAAYAELGQYREAIIDITRSAKLGCPDAWLLLEKANGLQGFHCPTGSEGTN